MVFSMQRNKITDGDDVDNDSELRRKLNFFSFIIFLRKLIWHSATSNLYEY